MILNGNDRVGEAKVYKTSLEMKQAKEIESLKKELESSNKKVKKYWIDVEYLEKIEAQNKKLRDCVEFYGDENNTNRFKESQHYQSEFDLDAGKKARECLKGIDEKL